MTIETKLKWFKTGKSLLIGMAGAGLAYGFQIASGFNFGPYSELAAVLLAFAANTVRVWVSKNV